MTITADAPTLLGVDGLPLAGFDADLANAITDVVSGRRVYVQPRTKEIFTSATTVLGIIAKDRLARWYADMAADAVLDNMLGLVRSPFVEVCDGVGGYCGECLKCLIHTVRHAAEVERDAAADRGKRFHNVAEHYALSGEVIPHDADIAGNVTQFLRFVDIHKVTFQCAEVTVLDRSLMVAGTLDTVLTCGWMPPKHRDLIGIPMYGDYKTGKSVYGQAALQLAAYRNAEAVMLPDGTEKPMPDGDREMGLSIQIRPENFWIRPAAIGDSVYEKFARTVALWRDIHEPDVDLIGRAMTKPRVKKEA